MSRPRNDSSDPGPSQPSPSPDELTMEAESPAAGILFDQDQPSPGPTPSPESPWSSSPSDPSPSRGADGGSPRPSTADEPDRRTLRQRVRELLPMIQAAVATVGGMAHQLLTREGTPERAVELYLPDEDDVTAISEPLAGLASRRMPEGADNPDVTDIARLVMGLATYGVKQHAKATVAREVAQGAQYAEDQAEAADQGADPSYPLA